MRRRRKEIKMMNKKAIAAFGIPDGASASSAGPSYAMARPPKP